MFVQFLAFPPMARRFGVLNCYKVVTMAFPFIYVLTPFTALLSTTLQQEVMIFAVMFMKCWAAIFAFPCVTILLTNSAVSLQILGTLNGVATSISAVGRALGPAIGGWMFSIGVKNGFVLLPWLALAFFAILGALPVWWISEMDGFGSSRNKEEGSDEEGEEAEILTAQEDGNVQLTGVVRAETHRT